MGKVEKVVFLSVLLLMVVIIAVSIPDGDGSDVNQDRIYTASKDSAQRAPPARQPAACALGDHRELARGHGGQTGGGPAGGATGGPGIPKSEPVVIDPAARRPRVAVARACSRRRDDRAGGRPREGRAGRPAGRSRLGPVSTQGLERPTTPNSSSMPAVAGDRYETLAARFYGSADQAAFAPQQRRPISSPRRGRTRAGLQGDTLQRSYTVRPGDSSWTIARDCRRRAKWRELFDANRGRLESPDALRAGLELLIP
ncbi:MAG: LysM domain-containing protein [Planctomycetota bacterium]